MTTLVSINPTHAGLSLHRYETAQKGGPICTHAGLYNLETVTGPNLQAYLLVGAPQDRVGDAQPRSAAARRSC